MGMTVAEMGTSNACSSSMAIEAGDSGGALDLGTVSHQSLGAGPVQ